MVRGTGSVQADHAQAEDTQAQLFGPLASTEPPQKQGGINRPKESDKMRPRTDRFAKTPKGPVHLRHGCQFLRKSAICQFFLEAGCAKKCPAAAALVSPITEGCLTTGHPSL